MKIAFVYPAIFGSGFNTEKKDILFEQIHEGLAGLGAVCKKEGFKDITLIDLRLLEGWDDFAEKIRQLAPDVAGVTMMSPDYPYATRCIDIIKDLDPRIKIIVGGHHPTIMTQEVADNPKVDHIVTGEGEAAFPVILKDIEAKRPVARIIEGRRPDLDTLPFIDRELFDFLELPYDFFLPLPFVTVLAGRGCSYNCSFCAPASKIMHGDRMRRRSVDNVMNELSYLRDTYGIKSIQFWDDCFTESRDWVMEFCKAYRKNGFRQPFVCQTRADIVCKNPEMIKELKKAGLVMASIGFESGSDRILKFLNKGTTVAQNLQAAAICKRLAIKIWAYHMLGLPGERPEEAKDTVRMINRIKPYRSSAAFFTPHPGSALHAYCRKNDLSLIGDHDNFVMFPEVDKPKIKGIDYALMRRLAGISKRPSLSVKVRIRIERVFAHKKSKAFRVKLLEALKEHPGMNKMAVLRIAHKKGLL